MPYAYLADAALMVHLAFIVFVVLGGLLALRFRYAYLLHLPALAWGIYVETTGTVCPLTHLENWLLQRSGATGYADSFISHHVMPIIYPEALTPELQALLAAALATFNIAVYGVVITTRLRNHSANAHTALHADHNTNVQNHPPAPRADSHTNAHAAPRTRHGASSHVPPHANTHEVPHVDTPAGPHKSWGWRIAASLTGLVALTTGGVYMLQDHLLYFPTKLTHEAMLADARQRGLAPWPTAADYRGLLYQPQPHARGTVVLFHGNAGHASQRDAYVALFQQAGLRVLLAEYPGYGARTGSPSEACITDDARHTLALVHQQFEGPLLVAGESLGAAVAAAALPATPATTVTATASPSPGTSAEAPPATPATALLLITPWDTLANVARHHYPWAPVRWLLRDRYDTVRNLANFRGRVALVIAGNDSIVPAPRAHALSATIATEHRSWTLPGAEHNDWMHHLPARWWHDITTYLLPPG